MPINSLILREIQPGDRVAGLSLGHPDFRPLKTFLRRDAHHYHQHNIAKTYVMVTPAKEPAVWAYISLMCSSIALEDNHYPEGIEEYRYPDFPAVKIARLAVDERIRSKGIGRTLVQFAVSIAKDRIMPAIGCRFLVVDSKPSAMHFYRRCGFTPLDTPQNTAAEHPLLYMDLHHFD